MIRRSRTDQLQRLTVSYAGTPSDPFDDVWLSDLSNIRVRGDWGFSEVLCEAMTANLT